MSILDRLEKRLEALERMLGRLEQPKQARYRTLFCDERVDRMADVEKIQRVAGNIASQTGIIISWNINQDVDGSYRVIGEIEHGL